MKTIIQLEAKDIAYVYGIDLNTANSGKIGYLMGKLKKCNDALIMGKPENFRGYLDLRNQKNFDKLMSEV